MSDKKPLEPLIPLEQLRGVVKKLIDVPKADLDKAEAERPKRMRREPGERVGSGDGINSKP